MQIIYPLYLLLTHLGIGVLIAMIFTSKREIKASYFRFNGLISLIALSIAFLILRFSEANNSFQTWRSALSVYWLACLILVLVYYLALRTEKRPLATILLYIAAIAGSLVIGLDAYMRTGARGEHLRQDLTAAIFFANYVASGLVLGFVLAAMILGHWYLIDPRLSLGHLKKAVMLFGIALIIRATLITATIVYFLHFVAVDRVERRSLNDLLDIMGNGIFFWIRLLTGLLGPILLSLLTWKTVNMRSTQSATGLLYVTVILVLFGELISKFLSVAVSIPV